MNEVVMLLGNKTVELLEYVHSEGIMVRFCYMTQGRWYTAIGKIIEIGAESFTLRTERRKKSQPVDLNAEQLVGISFQCSHSDDGDRFIFGTNVIIGQEDEGVSEQGVVLSLPEEIEIVRRKNYLRTAVPNSIKVDVELWHRSEPQEDKSSAAQVCHGWSARLIDIAADGLQVAVSSNQGPDFAAGQYVGLKFTPHPKETPISFNACVRQVMPTQQDDEMVIELEMVGLEASPEGRMVLRRLCGVISQYRQMLQITGPTPVPQTEDFEVKEAASVFNSQG